MDWLETIHNSLVLPDDLTLTELIWKIKEILSCLHEDKSVSYIHRT